MKLAIITVWLFIALFTCSAISAAAQYNPEVYQAQKALKTLGYSPGLLDGQWGKATESAIKRFQRDIKLPVTGLLDEETKVKLDMASLKRSLKQTVTPGEHRVALVIGNGTYRNAPLRNPVYDAADMADALERCGFEVDKKLNVPQETIEDAIREFGSKLHEGTIGLFYYSGHGVQVSGRNYLIPIGARIVKEKDVKYKAVDLYQVLDEMGSARNGLNIVILDACRDNPLQRSWRSKSQGLARIDGPKGTLIAYSTAPGSVAEDGEGRNGTYTKHLLRAMNVPGLPVEKVFKEVLKAVDSETGGKQTPWMSSSFTGDFYFASDLTPEPQTSMQLSDERAKLERERQELERSKLETEVERKKLETDRKRLEKNQKKKVVVASLGPKDREIGRDGNYIAYANGIVRNTETRLEWVAGPDKGTTWDDAKRWATTLNVSGGGWRMPLKSELKGLYQKGAGSRNMTPLLKTTGWWVWSGESPDSSSAWYFNFHYGGEGFFFRFDHNLERGFAVRNQK